MATPRGFAPFSSDAKNRWCAGDRPFHFKFETVTNLVPGKRHSTRLSLPLTSPQEQDGEQTAAGARGTRGRLRGNRRGRQGDAAAAVASRLRIYFERSSFPVGEFSCLTMFPPFSKLKLLKAALDFYYYFSLEKKELEVHF